jgi:hypothetical protein
MELSWINKLRIAAVAVLGIVTIGILAWPLAAPEDPLLPVRAGSLGLVGTLVLLGLAFGVGFVGYFVAWPHGREIGILGVPFGLAVWASRSGPMRALTQAYTKPYERAALLHSLRFEPLYWLLVIAAGFAGVLLAQHLRSAAAQPSSAETRKNYLNANMYINGLLALAVAALAGQFFVGVFAQNLTASYTAIAAQPAIGQIIFGVTAAFAVAAFITKKFLDVSYIWPAIASSFVFGVAEAIYCRGEVIQEFAETRPATLFPHSVLAILPIQLLALGALGSVLGYWLAIRYDYWRQHEST